MMRCRGLRDAKSAGGGMTPMTNYSPATVGDARWLPAIELDGVRLPFRPLDQLSHVYLIECAESALRLVEAGHAEAHVCRLQVLDKVVNNGPELFPRLSERKRRLLEEMAPGIVAHLLDVLRYRVDREAHRDTRFKVNGKSGRRYRLTGPEEPSNAGQ
jgi:hypothetical protein